MCPEYLMNCEMPDVKLKVDSPMMADYLAYLFPPESPDGPLKVSARNSVGKLLIAHCKVSERPVPSDGDGFVELVLPNDEATKPLVNRFLYYNRHDTAALNMAVSAFFDIEFRQYCLAGSELGFRKKDIVSAFIVSRGLFSTDGFDALHKRVYRRSQRTFDKMVGKLLQRVHYIDRTINLKGLNDDQNH